MNATLRFDATAVRAQHCAAGGALLLALVLAGCSRSTQPVSTYAITGHVRLVSTLIGSDSRITGSRTLDTADGVPVDLLRGGVVVAHTTTHGGAYRFSGMASAGYVVRAGVLPTIATATNIVVVASADLALPSPLVLTTVGDLYPAPNPIGPGSWIYFEMADSEVVRVVVRDASGNPLRTLLDGGVPAGLHSVYWNVTDANSNPVTGSFFWVTYEGASGDRQFVLLPY